jgi:MFS family permease
MTSPGLRVTLRGLPRPVWVLAAGTFVNRFGSFVLVFLVLYVKHLGYSTAAAGLAASVYGAGSIVSALFGGWFADRLGRRSSLALSMFSSAAAMLALSQARPLVAILAFSAIVGFTTELYRPASAALLADLVTPEQRVAAFGLLRFAINLGYAAGPVVAGLLAQRSFLLLFLGDAATSVAFGVLALVALPQGMRVEAHLEVRGETVRAIAHDRRFLLFLGASVLGSFVYFQAQTTFALQVVAYGHSSVIYGALLAVNGVAIVLLELPLISVTQRLPRANVLTAGLLLEGVGFGLIPLSGATAWLAFTVIIWTFGEMVFSPVASAYVADLSPVRLRGRYSGAWGFTWGIGLVLAPSLGALIYSTRHTLLWLVCLGCGLVAATLVVASERLESHSNKQGDRPLVARL